MIKRRIALDIAHTGFVENYRIEAALGVIEYARQHTHWQLLCNEQNLSLTNKFTRYSDLERLDVEGIIFSFWAKGKHRHIQELGVPAVSISNDYPGQASPYSCVVSDDVQIGRIAAEHFLERGFRDLGFYGDLSLRWEAKRWIGFRSVVEAAGLKCHVRARGVEISSRQEAVALREWLKSLPKPIAILCANDPRALHILEACQPLGFEVPRHIALIGVDNSPLICEAQLPSISSIELDPRKAGYEAAALLDRMLEEGRQLREEITIPPRGVVTRMSTDVLAVDDEPVTLALLFIRDRAQEPIQIKDVVRASGVSRSTLERRFRERLSSTINDMLRQRRLETAKQLLLKSKMSLEDIARASGFRRSTYLCNVFQEEYGTTPREWRQRYE
ncbi:MAG: XylR family transcriptional regulator [Sumerlaeia bacterium]